MKKITKWLVPILMFVTVVSVFTWVTIGQERKIQQLQDGQAFLEESQELQRLEQKQQELMQQMLDLQTRLEENQEEQQQQIQLLMEQILAQQTQIQEIQSELDRFVQASQGKLGDGGSFVMNSSADTYDYLAIGNSITRHAECDYWKNGQSGMAASTADKDYFHRVVAGLTERGNRVNSHVLSLYAWEAVASDRAQMAALVDMYLTKDLDLVTIQLGENARDLTTLEEDFVYLIQRIRELAPNAQILLIGDFWSFENRNAIKQTAAEKAGAAFVSLDPIMDDPAYQAGLDAVFYDKYGEPYQVSHGGVAKHPSDEAMAFMADAILSVLKSLQK